MRIRVQGSDETGPVALQHGDNTGVGGRVRRRSLVRDILRAEEGVYFNGVRSSGAVFLGPRVLHGEVVVPGWDAGFGVDRGQVDTRADVAEFAVCVAGGTPVGLGVGECLCLVLLEVKVVDLAELGLRDTRELVLEEGVGLLDAASHLRHEDRAFVCIIAEDGGHLDELPFVKEG